jgi:hypothetical protein
MTEETEQPTDYVKIDSFEEFFDQEYKELNLWGKITYHLQDHAWKAIFVSVAVGYLAGTHFGVFW